MQPPLGEIDNLDSVLYTCDIEPFKSNQIIIIRSDLTSIE